MTKPILIATDLTLTSEQATLRGVSLARELGADAILVHAWESPAFVLLDVVVASSPEKLAAHTGQLRHRLDEIAAVHCATGKELSTRLLEGAPAEAIAAFAREIDARMVVIGTSKHSTLGRILGSRADTILQAVECPVLVVRAANA
jgi:universal stress protein A